MSANEVLGPLSDSEDHRRSTLADALAEHRKRMLRFAKSIVKNPADAEDVVQEALLRAWRSRERYDATRDPGPWLMRITRNAALDYLRQRLDVETEDFDRVCAPAEQPERKVVRLEEARSLAYAIRHLAPAHRTAFLLHDVQGYSSREVSAQIHLPYHTVRTHLFRARRQLRSAFDGEAS